LPRNSSRGAAAKQGSRGVELATQPKPGQHREHCYATGHAAQPRSAVSTASACERSQADEFRLTEQLRCEVERRRAKPSGV